MTLNPNKTLVFGLATLLTLSLSGLRGAQADGYVLGPDDAVSVVVLRHPELSAPALTVTDDGTIRLQGVGEIVAAGRTAAQVQALIVGRLRERLVAPEVTVAVIQQRPKVVFVLGVVRNPGVFPMKPGWRVAEALAAAGGLLCRPDEVKAVLLRSGQDRLALDIQAALGAGDVEANVALLPGDVLNMTSRTIRVSVAGNVLKPGPCEMAAGGGALEAIGLSGGIGPRADLRAVVVKRPTGEQRKVDLLPALLEGKVVQDPALQDGDTVIVPTCTARVAVVGAVRQPGSFELVPGVPVRVTELVARGGGLVARPEAIMASLLRQDGRVITLDMKAALTDGSVATNPEVDPGDTLSVLERVIRVDVVGQVRSPGPQTIPTGSCIAQAVAAAGGVAASSSGTALGAPALREVVLRRCDGTQRKVDLYSVLIEGKLEQNVALNEGDTVIVPESRARVAVLGAVAKPGYYPLDADNPPTITQLVAQAGGPLERARIQETALVRVGPAGAQPVKVDLKSILRGGKIAADRIAQDRDVIYVPPARADWDFILRAVGTVAVLGNWLVTR